MSAVTPDVMGRPRLVRDQHRGPILLDASFVIAVLEGEAAAVELSWVLQHGVITTVTAGEVFYKQAARFGHDAQSVYLALADMGVRFNSLSLDVALQFPQLKAIDALRRAEQKTNGEPAAALSLADLCVLGHAQIAGFPVLTGDRHWSTLIEHGLMIAVFQFRQGLK